MSRPAVESKTGTKRSRSTWLLAAAAALCVLGVPSRAMPQEGRPSSSRNLGDNLDARDRGFMHPDLETSVIVGLEQEGNSFRHRTPGLAEGNLAPAMIDLDESRARRLAMFDGRTFLRPVRSAAGSGSGSGASGGEDPEALEPAPVEDAADVSGTPTGLLVLGVLLAVALAWTVQHKLRARLASIS